MLPTSSRGRLCLVAVSVAAVLIAPLATTGAANAVEISGARTLSDSVVVDFDKRPPTTSDVHLLAFNDFHGNLEPAGLNIYGRFAGGAAYLAKLVADKQKQYPREVTLFAGDNIGAAPLSNSLFDEEPAVIVSNHMKVDVASVGNHEFDKGATELQRIQQGGCPAEGCSGAPYARPDRQPTTTYPGADFRYLSTNVVTKDGKALLGSTYTKQFKSESGRKFEVGFIGETLQATPTIVTPAGVAGLTFLDEADAANKAAAKMRRDGVKIPVLIVHQGGFQTAPAAINVDAAAPLANQVIGSIQGNLTRSGAGESTLGDVIADSQLAATAPAAVGSAQIAFMNPGGIRADLNVNDISSGGEAPGEVTYGEAFTVQPFGNSLVVKSMTGAQIRTLLQQQFAGCNGQATNRTLQVSTGFSYTQVAATLPAAPTPEQCVANIGTITLGGTPIDPAASYRVTMNSFLATGGDGFATFNDGTNPIGGGQDIDALVAAFAAAKPAGIAVPALNRIVTTG